MRPQGPSMPVPDATPRYQVPSPDLRTPGTCRLPAGRRRETGRRRSGPPSSVLDDVDRGPVTEGLLVSSLQRLLITRFCRTSVWSGSAPTPVAQAAAVVATPTGSPVHTAGSGVSSVGTNACTVNAPLALVVRPYRCGLTPPPPQVAELNGRWRAGQPQACAAERDASCPPTRIWRCRLSRGDSRRLITTRYAPLLAREPSGRPG